jgi:hypothetical protein
LICLFQAESDEEQYNKQVCEGAYDCERVLGIMVHIFNVQKDGVDKTVCWDCGEEMMMQHGWVDMDAEVCICFDLC